MSDLPDADALGAESGRLVLDLSVVEPAVALLASVLAQTSLESMLSGSTAMRAWGLVDRPCRDVDFFVAQPMTDAVAGIITEALRAEGATVDMAWSDDAKRIDLIVGLDGALLDADVSSEPGGRTPVPTPIGPVRHYIDLIEDKVEALLVRAFTRDVLDVFRLAQLFPAQTGAAFQVVARRFPADRVPYVCHLVTVELEEEYRVSIGDEVWPDLRGIYVDLGSPAAGA